MAEGGSVNFRDVTFNPHAHGIHTETREHVRDDSIPLMPSRSGALPLLVPSLLVDAHPESAGDDWIVPLSALARHAPWMQTHQPSAVILRCTNGDVQRNWSQTNPII